MAYYYYLDNDVTVADFELNTSNGFARAVSITEDQFNWGAANKPFTYNELLLMFKVPPSLHQPPSPQETNEQIIARIKQHTVAERESFLDSTPYDTTFGWSLKRSKTDRELLSQSLVKSLTAISNGASNSDTQFLVDSNDRIHNMTRYEMHDILIGYGNSIELAWANYFQLEQTRIQEAIIVEEPPQEEPIPDTP